MANREVSNNPHEEEIEVTDARDLRIAALNCAILHPYLCSFVLLSMLAVAVGCLSYAVETNSYSAPDYLFAVVITSGVVLFCFGFLIAAQLLRSSFETQKEFLRSGAGASPENPHSPVNWLEHPPCITIVDDLFHDIQQTGALGSIPAAHDVRDIFARYELLTTNIAASVILFDAHGRVQLCSPYTEVLTGYPVEDIAHGGEAFFRELVLPDDRERFHRAWEVARLGEDIFVRYRMQHRSGLTLWLETRLVPVSGDQENVTSIMSVTIDVTDIVNYQRQIEDQNRDLKDFASMVSHDLKAPIFTIKGMASALIEDYGETLSKDGRELLEHIISAGTRLEKLVTSILAYSKAAAADGPDELVDFHEVLETIEEDLGGMIKQEKAIIHRPAKSVALRGSFIHLYQIFSNLIGNALKYRDPSRPPVVSLDVLEGPLGFVTITVSDNGRGIPSSKLDLIFRPFQRVHGDSIEGSGVGLACVKRLTERLGGTVSVRSEEGRGTEMMLTLPTAAARPTAQWRSERQLKKDSLKKDSNEELHA